MARAQEHPFLLNAGLPRTGTTSFSRACRLAGLRALHSWEPSKPLGNEDQRDRWWREQWNRVLHGEPGELLQYDSLSDNPFMFQVSRFRSAFPNATVVCTTRSRETWVNSILRCKPNNCAGGLYLPRQHPQLGLHYPYRNDTTTRAALSELFDLHYATECIANGALLLDLRSDSDELWTRLCTAVPAQYRVSCVQVQTKRAPWPGSHARPGSEAAAPSTRAAAGHNAVAAQAPECPFEVPTTPEHVPPAIKVLETSCAPWDHAHGVNAPIRRCARQLNPTERMVGQGFGSYLHRVAQAALLASSHGTRFVPMLHPRVQSYLPLADASNISRVGDCADRLHCCLFDVPSPEMCHNTSDLGKVWPGSNWRALGLQSASHLFREASTVLAGLLKPREGFAATLALPPPPRSHCIAVQIRAGDSCIKAASRQRRCDPLAKFLNATLRLVEHYRVRRVVVASDSSRERDAFLAMLPPFVHAVSLRLHRTCAHSQLPKP